MPTQRRMQQTVPDRLPTRVALIRPPCKEGPMNKSTGTARDKPLPGGWTALLNYLAALPPGPVADTAVERLLAACWDELSGDAGGVKPYMLLGRTEDVTWTPP